IHPSSKSNQCAVIGGAIGLGIDVHMINTELVRRSSNSEHAVPLHRTIATLERKSHHPKRTGDIGRDREERVVARVVVNNDGLVSAAERGVARALKYHIRGRRPRDLSGPSACARWN